MLELFIDIKKVIKGMATPPTPAKKVTAAKPPPAAVAKPAEAAAVVAKPHAAKATAKATATMFTDMGFSQGEAAEIVGGEGLQLDDELLSGMDDFVVPPNGPEMAGLAAAGDNDPPSKVRIVLTQSLWDTTKAEDYDTAIRAKIAMVTALATLGFLETSAELCGTKNSGTILVLGLMVSIQFRMLYTTGATRLESEAQVAIVNGETYKRMVSKGKEHINSWMAVHGITSMAEVKEMYAHLRGKVFGLILSTKVSYYLTNHHTTSTSEWVSYSGKYMDAVMEMSDDSCKELQTSVSTIGHMATTRGILRWMYSFIPEYSEMDALFGGPTLSAAASSAFMVGHDIALRLRQAPAGARYPGNVVAVAKRFVESAYAAFIPMEIVDHVMQCTLWSKDIAKRPILYHIGAGYLTAGKRPVVDRFDIEKNEECDEALRAFLDAIMPKSNLTKMKALSGSPEGTDLMVKLQSAKAQLVKVGGAGSNVADLLSISGPGAGGARLALGPGYTEDSPKLMSLAKTEMKVMLSELKDEEKTDAKKEELLEQSKRNIAELKANSTSQV